MAEEEGTVTPPEGLDIEATVEDIASDLGLVQEEVAEAGKAAAEAGEGETANEEVAEPVASPPAEAPAEPAAAPAAADAPPDTWRKEAQAKWATIPPELRQEIRKREADISKYVGETKNAVTISKAFEKVVEPYVQMFNQTGIDPWQHTANLLQAHAMLTWGTPQQKLTAFQGLAQGAGIDLRAFAQGDAQNAVNNPYMQRIQQLEARISQLASGVTGVTSTIQQARTQELESGVMAFAKDEKAHPFFWEVTGEIQNLLHTGAAKDLETAYELAVYANPLTRQKVMDAEAEKRIANRASLEKARAEKARKAAGANVQSRGRGRAAPPQGSIDDTLKETLADIHSRPH